jgi:hypothetical protein
MDEGKVGVCALMLVACLVRTYLDSAPYKRVDGQYSKMRWPSSPMLIWYSYYILNASTRLRVPPAMTQRLRHGFTESPITS